MEENSGSTNTTEAAPRKTRRRWQWLGLAAVAGAIAGVGAVYFIGSGAGNVADAANCPATMAAVARAAPFARGEVAAFRVADRPESMADLAFKGPDGKDTTLAAFKGKTVLVNVWATWCIPCRKEMPALGRLQAAEGGKGFEVVAVDVDLNGADKARAFLGEIGVDGLPFYADPSMALFARLRGRGLLLGLPTSFLVDGDGCRVGVVEGPAEWDSDDARALIGAARGA